MLWPLLWRDTSTNIGRFLLQVRQEPDQELVPVPPVVAAKLALCSAMTEQHISKVELGRRLGVSEAAVRRLANPDHRSHMSQVQRALNASRLHRHPWT